MLGSVIWSDRPVGGRSAPGTVAICLGAAEVGYGDGGEATTVSFGADENNKYVTTYFRHTFNVADPLSLGTWLERLQLPAPERDPEPAPVEPA